MVSIGYSTVQSGKRVGQPLRPALCEAKCGKHPVCRDRRSPAFCIAERAKGTPATEGPVSPEARMPGGAELNKEVHTSRTSCAPVHKAIPGQIVSVEPWMTNKEVLMPLETWRSGGGEARADGGESGRFAQARRAAPPVLQSRTGQTKTLNKEVHTSRTSCAPVHKAIRGQIVSAEPWRARADGLPGPQVRWFVTPHSAKQSAANRMFAATEGREICSQLQRPGGSLQLANSKKRFACELSCQLS